MDKEFILTKIPPAIQATEKSIGYLYYRFLENPTTISDEHFKIMFQGGREKLKKYITPKQVKEMLDIIDDGGVVLLSKEKEWRW